MCAERGRLKVIYVNWDGFAWDYYAEARQRGLRLPGLERLATEGALFEQAFTGVPSLTVPMQTSLITGAWPDVHHNTMRYFDRATGRVKESGRRNDAETLAEACRRQGLRVAAVNQFTVKGRGTTPGDPANPYLEAGADYRRRFAAARRVWSESTPDLLCLYCDDLDAVGHNFAWWTNGLIRAHSERHRRHNVLRQLCLLDRELARLLSQLSPAGPAEGVLVALATDHGMTRYQGTSSLPALLARVASLGIPVEVCVSGEAPRLENGLAITTFGLQLQIYFVGELGTGAKAREASDAIIRCLAAEPYFGGALRRDELLARGAHPDFADLLIWPRPPHHFKTSRKRYAARGQHDSPDPNSAHVFLGLWGGGVKPGGRLKRPVSLVDLAPTLAAAMEVDPPRDATGRVLYEAWRWESYPADDGVGRQQASKRSLASAGTRIP